MKTWILACSMLATAFSARAEGGEGKLAAPTGLTVTAHGLAPEFAWDAVDGAEIYRLAVFAGKNTLMAAVWVAQPRWIYGKDKFIAKAGKLPSKPATALQAGKSYKWWVKAARQDGTDESEWVKADLVIPEASAAAEPVSAAAEGTSDTLNAAAAPLTKTAKPEEVEFTESPTGAAVTPTATAASGLDAAKALLDERKFPEAQEAFQKLTVAEPKNSEAWAGLGDSFLGQKLKIEAMEAYRNALELDPQNQRIREWMKSNVKP